MGTTDTSPEAVQELISNLQPYVDYCNCMDEQWKDCVEIKHIQSAIATLKQLSAERDEEHRNALNGSGGSIVIPEGTTFSWEFKTGLAMENGDSDV